MQMHALKNTTTNLTLACINRTMLNDCVDKVTWDDAIVRKKCLTTNIVNNVNLLTMTSLASANARIKKHNNQPKCGACGSNNVE